MSTPNTLWITVEGSGTAECDGLYCPSTAPEKVSESGTKSSLGYWNGKMAWDRVDGKAKRNPSISYSRTYKAWRIAKLDGHLAYDITNDDVLPTVDKPWNVYKKGQAPAPKITIHDSDPRPKKPNTLWITIEGSGTAECDGLYCPSTAPEKVSESGTKSSLGYWNAKMAWDRVDGKAKRNPSISYSQSYKAWRIARLDGHLAYTIVNDDELPTLEIPWDCYVTGRGITMGESPAPKITIHESDPRPNVVFVLGGPGAGKGTMCEISGIQLNWCHLSAGDLLRAERKKEGSPNADLINSYIKEGKIVPVEITVKLLQTAMAESGKKNFLIDGFPRSLDNLQGWESVMGSTVNVAFMLFFECPLKQLTDRILARAKYSGRSDDNVESLTKRFKTYKDETMPIVELFKQKGKCIEVNTGQKRDVVYAEVKAALAPMTESLAVLPLTEKSEILLGLRRWPPREKKHTEASAMAVKALAVGTMALVLAKRFGYC